MVSDSKKYLTVSALTQYLKYKFDHDPYLERVYLTGEISNFRLRPTNQYFSLKDDHAKIGAMMFANAFRKLKFTPEMGMKVLVIGRIDLYPPSGDYQIIIDHMEPDGVGALYQAYEQLKNKLAAEGLFNRPKKSLPLFPQRIAVITSESGAVIHDIMTTVARRYPLAQIVLFPARVQGEGAADDLVKQIKHVQSLHNFDVLIIGRGGGSLEDLWPFNEEKVARALATVDIPVISSVGHETDTTLTDLVADQRAATPTAAAEYATPVLSEVIAQLHDYQKRLLQAIQRLINDEQQRLHRLQQRPVMQNPQMIYTNASRQVDMLSQRLTLVIKQYLQSAQQQWQNINQRLQQQNPQVQITNHIHDLQNVQTNLENAVRHYIDQKQQSLLLLTKNLHLLNPLQVLQRGYAYVTDEQGKVLSQAHDYHDGQQALIHINDAVINVTINHVQQRGES